MGRSRDNGQWKSDQNRRKRQWEGQETMEIRSKWTKKTMGRSRDNGIRRNNGNPTKIDEKDNEKIKRQWDHEKQWKSGQNRRKRQWEGQETIRSGETMEIRSK